MPLYVYSNRNIAGSGLALVALAAFFGGVIHELWYVIVAGAYGIGALAAHDDGALETHINAEMNVKDAVDAVTRLAAAAGRKPAPTFVLSPPNGLEWKPAGGTCSRLAR